VKLIIKENSRLKLFLLMIKYPEKDWRTLIRKIITAPSNERGAILSESSERWQAKKNV
jgi:hypothetical protein